VATVEPATPSESQEPARSVSADPVDANGSPGQEASRPELGQEAERPAVSADTAKPKGRRWQKVIRSSLWQKEPWQNYGLAVLFVGVFPLLPLISEWLGRREISEDALIITTAVYSVTAALASTNKFFFGALLAASILVASTYGLVADPSQNAHVAFSHFLGIRTYAYTADLPNNNTAFAVVVVGGFLSVVVERYSRHVRGREEFFEFLRSKKDPQ
jgi:hypothetical protein